MILTALQVNVARAIGILGNPEVNHRSKYIHDSDVEHSSVRWPIRDDSTNQRKHKFQKKKYLYKANQTHYERGQTINSTN